MDLVFDPRHAQSCAGAEEAARCVRDNEELIDRALRGSMRIEPPPMLNILTEAITWPPFIAVNRMVLG